MFSKIGPMFLEEWIDELYHFQNEVVVGTVFRVSRGRKGQYCPCFSLSNKRHQLIKISQAILYFSNVSG